MLYQNGTVYQNAAVSVPLSQAGIPLSHYPPAISITPTPTFLSVNSQVSLLGSQNEQTANSISPQTITSLHKQSPISSGLASPLFVGSDSANQFAQQQQAGNNMQQIPGQQKGISPNQHSLLRTGNVSSLVSIPEDSPQLHFDHPAGTPGNISPGSLLTTPLGSPPKAKNSGLLKKPLQKAGVSGNVTPPELNPQFPGQNPNTVVLTGSPFKTAYNMYPAEIEFTVDQAKQVIEYLRAENFNLQGHIHYLVAELETSNTNLASITEAETKASSEVKSLHKGLEWARDEKKLLKKDKDKLKCENDDLKTENEKLLERIENLEASETILKAESEALKADVELKEAENAEMRARMRHFDSAPQTATDDDAARVIIPEKDTNSRQGSKSFDNNSAALARAVSDQIITEAALKAQFAAESSGTFSRNGSVSIPTKDGKEISVETAPLLDETMTFTKDHGRNNISNTNSRTNLEMKTDDLLSAALKSEALSEKNKMLKHFLEHNSPNTDNSTSTENVGLKAKTAKIVINPENNALILEDNIALSPAEHRKSTKEKKKQLEKSESNSAVILERLVEKRNSGIIDEQSLLEKLDVSETSCVYELSKEPKASNMHKTSSHGSAPAASSSVVIEKSDSNAVLETRILEAPKTNDEPRHSTNPFSPEFMRGLGRLADRVEIMPTEEIHNSTPPLRKESPMQKPLENELLGAAPVAQKSVPQQSTSASSSQQASQSQSKESTGVKSSTSSRSKSNSASKPARKTSSFSLKNSLAATNSAEIHIPPNGLGKMKDNKNPPRYTAYTNRDSSNRKKSTPRSGTYNSSTKTPKSAGSANLYSHSTPTGSGLPMSFSLQMSPVKKRSTRGGNSSSSSGGLKQNVKPGLPVLDPETQAVIEERIRQRSRSREGSKSSNSLTQSNNTVLHRVSGELVLTTSQPVTPSLAVGDIITKATASASQARKDEGQQQPVIEPKEWKDQLRSSGEHKTQKTPTSSTGATSTKKSYPRGFEQAIAKLQKAAKHGAHERKKAIFLDR